MILTPGNVVAGSPEALDQLALDKRACQNAPLRRRRERGASEQAIGVKAWPEQQDSCADCTVGPECVSESLPALTRLPLVGSVR